MKFVICLGYRTEQLSAGRPSQRVPGGFSCPAGPTQDPSHASTARRRPSHEHVTQKDQERGGRNFRNPVGFELFQTPPHMDLRKSLRLVSGPQSDQKSQVWGVGG